MELHHKKHHATYVNNLNAAEEALENAVEAGEISNSSSDWKFFIQKYFKALVISHTRESNIRTNLFISPANDIEICIH